MATNGNVNHGSVEQLAAQSATVDATNSGGSNSNLSKDEIGWYFVEQYYKTLSKSPEKLHVSIRSPVPLLGVRYLAALTDFILSSSTASPPSLSTARETRWLTFPSDGR